MSYWNHFTRVSILFILYFVQGLPYGFQDKFLPVYLKLGGLSYSHITLLKLVLLPWIGKAFLAPLVDYWYSKNWWLICTMVALSTICMIGSVIESQNIPELAGVLFFMNLFTAIQDIAVDGIAISVLNSDELGHGNAAQVVGYKCGAVAGGSLLVWVQHQYGWSQMYLAFSATYVVALIFAVSTTTSYLVSPAVRDKKTGGRPSERLKVKLQKKEARTKPQDFKLKYYRTKLKNHVSSLIQTPGTSWVIFHVLFYKLAERGTLNIFPLYLLDKGINRDEVYWWNGLASQTSSIIGSLYGGWLLGHTPGRLRSVLLRYSSLRTVLVLVQFLVVLRWDETQALSLLSILMGSELSLHKMYYYFLSVFSMCYLNFVAGVITTATFTLMMRCSQFAQSKVQASHYSTLATMEVLGKLMFSVIVGPLMDSLGVKSLYFIFLLMSAGPIIIVVHLPGHLST